MRSLFYTLEALLVIALAYWAYNENYATQEALRRVDSLQSEIGKTRETLSVLRAEWAYLNRPDRLRELADLNFDSLRLMPLSPESFAEVEQVAYPRLVLEEISEPVDLVAEKAPEVLPDTEAPAKPIIQPQADNLLGPENQPVGGVFP